MIPGSFATASAASAPDAGAVIGEVGGVVPESDMMPSTVHLTMSTR